MDQSEIDALIADELAKPKSVQTGAGKVESKSADEIIALTNAVRKPRRPPFAVTRAVPPGAVGPRRSSDGVV